MEDDFSFDLEASLEPVRGKRMADLRYRQQSLLKRELTHPTAEGAAVLETLDFALSILEGRPLLSSPAPVLRRLGLAFDVVAEPVPPVPLIPSTPPEPEDVVVAILAATMGYDMTPHSARGLLEKYANKHGLGVRSQEVVDNVIVEEQVKLACRPVRKPVRAVAYGYFKTMQPGIELFHFSAYREVVIGWATQEFDRNQHDLLDGLIGGGRIPLAMLVGKQTHLLWPTLGAARAARSVYRIYYRLFQVRNYRRGEGGAWVPLLRYRDDPSTPAPRA